MNYVLYGVEQYLMNKKIKDIIKTNIDFEPEMNTSYFDMQKSTIEDIIADCQTIPFFASKKVVVVYNCGFLTTATGNKNINVDALQNYLKQPCDSTVLVLTTNEEKLDKRKGIVKFITKDKTIETLSFSMLNEYERTNFINKEVKQYKLKFDKDAYELFVDRVGYSPTNIHNELDKLSLYSSTISRQDVENLVHRPLDDNVFLLFDVLLNRNMNKVFSYWQDFKELNIEPIALIALLANQYRLLYQVKVLDRKGLYKSDIAKELSVHPFRVEKTLALIHRMTLDEIAKTLNDLATLDQNIKAGKVDKNLGFELFLLHLCK